MSLWILRKLKCYHLNIKILLCSVGFKLTWKENTAIDYIIDPTKWFWNFFSFDLCSLCKYISYFSVLKLQPFFSCFILKFNQKFYLAFTRLTYKIKLTFRMMTQNRNNKRKSERE